MRENSSVRERISGYVQVVIPPDKYNRYILSDALRDGLEEEYIVVVNPAARSSFEARLGQYPLIYNVLALLGRHEPTPVAFEEAPPSEGDYVDVAVSPAVVESREVRGTVERDVRLYDAVMTGWEVPTDA